ncbi:MAG: TRAP transporter large permease [Candidatus Limnocylindria bacterium]
MITAGIAVAALFILMLAGIPMVLSLTVTVTLYLFMSGGWSLALPQQIVSGMNGFILLALPLFILAGMTMNVGGLSTRIFEFARSLVGHMRGGLAQVNVGTSMFFGGLIGTSIADLAGTGSVVIPEMKRRGYPASFAAAVSASSSGIGPLIPPSSPMILYSAVTGVSLGTMFVAGILPGLLLGLSQMVIVAYLARKRGWGAFSTFSWREVLSTFRGALLAFGMPAIVVGGIVFGVFTPTEAGAFAAVYAIVVCVLVYRSISLRQLYRLAVNSAALTGEVMMILGISVAFGTFLSSARVPEGLAEVLDVLAIGDSTTMKLVAMIVFALIAGMILDPLIPIVVPIVLPALVLADIDLVQFGVLIVVTVVVGQVTPPLAICLVVAGRIARVDLFDAFRANMPFLIGMILVIVLIIFVPEVATWLPSLLGR